MRHIIVDNLNIYFWIAQGLLTSNAFLYTHSVMKDKLENWKIDLGLGIFVYILISFLMFKMTTT